ncbi:MAG: Crp/Fnr family transcriptional regulator [Proteobacteria bacterium]|nr:Crp/Fnr family transcriptional regulator [Pseudomonadota bacterium]
MQTQDAFASAYRVLAQRLLAQAPGFARCPPEVVADLIEEAVVTRAAARELLLRRNEHSDHLLLVVEGALEARIDLGGGRRHLLSFMLPGMLAGYLSFLDQGVQPHDLVAHVPSVLLRMPEAAVRRLCRTRFELGQAFQTQLAARLRLMYELHAYSLSFSLRDRLTRQLVMLADSVGVRRGEQWMLDVQMSQADLADLLGAGRQAINAELQRLQDEGLVSIGRSRIRVLDLAALRARIPEGLPAALLRIV